MVRINLLPQKREQRRSGSEGGQAWMFVILGVVVLEIVILLFVHKAKEDELVKVQRDNEKIKTSIEEIKRQTTAHTEVKAQLKLLRDREEAIQKLQSARTGPTASLLEVARVLTPGRGPTTDRDKLEQLKRDNPAAAPNMNWDPHRLWLTQFTENSRTVKIGGLARDGEDVSEFLRRLSLSDFFENVQLMPASRQMDAVSKVEVVKFELQAKVKY